MILFCKSLLGQKNQVVLYDHGDQCVDKTAGWKKSSSNGTVTFNDDHIYIAGLWSTSDRKYYNNAGIATKSWLNINSLGISKIYADIYVESATTQSNIAYVRVGINNSNTTLAMGTNLYTDTYTPGSGSYTAIYDYAANPVADSYSAYIKMAISGGNSKSYGQMKIRVYKIWGEK